MESMSGLFFRNKNGELSHIGVCITLWTIHTVNFKKEAVFAANKSNKCSSMGVTACSFSICSFPSCAHRSLFPTFASSSVNFDCALACCNMSILCQKHDPNISSCPCALVQMRWRAHFVHYRDAKQPLSHHKECVFLLPQRVSSLFFGIFHVTRLHWTVVCCLLSVTISY